MSRLSGARACMAAAFLVASVAAAAVPGVIDAQPRAFGLPFADPPGPATWFVAQPYGNTIYAYFERSGLYRSGQGMHMGLDLAAACGMPVVAIGDGVVLSVDGRGGSPPHNLMIDHRNGYVSFYGHLLERPFVSVGQQVARGEHVAFSGDMYGTCHDSPHLHLEVRNESLDRLYNPVLMIDADWHNILLLGAKKLSYEIDLENPGRWVSIDDQPNLRLGGPLLNQYEHCWPEDGS